MSMVIAIAGPEFAGQPQITLRASGGYSPDVMDDLINRARELYLDLFDEYVEAPAGDGPDNGSEAV